MSDDSYYDATTWILRIPFIFISLFYVVVLVLVVRQQLKNRAALNLKYGKNSLLLYCISVVATVLLREIYLYSGDDAIPMSKVMFLFVSYYPVTITHAACTFFLNYLLNSLQSRFGVAQRKRYILFEKITQTFLAILLPFQTALCIYSVYQRSYKSLIFDLNWDDIYFVVSDAVCVIISAFLIYIIRSYNEKLKTFGVSFEGRKRAILFVIIIIAIQLLARATQAIMIIKDTLKFLEETSKKDNRPYVQTYIFFYFILTDILPFLAYTYYIDKDTEKLTVFEMTEDSFDDNSGRRASKDTLLASET